MGNSRVLFVGVLSVILGIATEQFKRSDARLQALAVARAEKITVETIASGGLRIALNQIRASRWQDQTNRTYLGGSYNYTIVALTPQDGQDRAQIVCTAEYNGYSCQAVGVTLEVGSSIWKLTSLYVSPLSPSQQG